MDGMEHDGMHSDHTCHSHTHTPHTNNDEPEPGSLVSIGRQIERTERTDCRVVPAPDEAGNSVMGLGFTVRYSAVGVGVNSAPQ